MSKQRPTNVAASVRDRLLNRARARGEDYNALLTRYAVERFLYRLGRSEHRERFVLKGATLFVLWEGNPHRITRDLDLLGRGAPEVEDVVGAVRDVCAVEVEDDGLTFDPGPAAGERIREDQAYEGVRVTVLARLGRARVPLQVDVGFGDAITPDAEEATLPTILGAPPPVLRAYPRETVVAEKVQAMVLLGMANTRMKDFYDVAYLARHFSFDGPTLTSAFQATFERRGTPLPEGTPLALSDEFAGDTMKQTQWRAFLQKARLDAAGVEAAVDLQSVVEALCAFLLPPLRAAALGELFERVWTAAGPWRAT